VPDGRVRDEHSRSLMRQTHYAELRKRWSSGIRSQPSKLVIPALAAAFHADLVVIRETGRVVSPGG